MAKDDEAEIKKEIDRVTKQIGELSKTRATLQKKLADKGVSPKVLAPLEKKWKSATGACDTMMKNLPRKRGASGGGPSAPAPMM